MKFSIISIFFSLLSFNCLGQIGEDPIPPLPPSLIYRDTWETLTDTEKSLFLNAKKTIKSINSNSDSLFRVLSDYLSNLDYISGYQAREVAKLINQISGEEPLLFLLNNVDVQIGDEPGGINQQWRNFPFYAALQSNDSQRRLDEIVSTILTSNLLEECNLNGKKLKYFRFLLHKKANHKDSITNSYLDLALKKHLDGCKEENLRYMREKKYPNYNYSTEVRQN